MAILNGPFVVKAELATIGAYPKAYSLFEHSFEKTIPFNKQVSKIDFF